jgi:hypothetical protein
MKQNPVSKLLALLVVAILAMLMAAAAPAMAWDNEQGSASDDNEQGDNGDQAFKCNGTFTGVTINSDVIVPPNAVCILNSSTVKGGVLVQTNAYFQSTNTTIKEDVQGNQAQTVFIDTGSKVSDNVLASQTGQVFVFNSTIGGGVGVDRTTATVNVCGNTVNGAGIGIVRSGRDILVGDPLTLGCGANTVSRGSVLIAQNNTDVELVIRGNSVPNGSMYVLNNVGTSDKFVQANNGGKTLKCTGNAAPFVGGPNGTWVSKQGQCF